MPGLPAGTRSAAAAFSGCVQGGLSGHPGKRDAAGLPRNAPDGSRAYEPCEKWCSGRRLSDERKMSEMCKKAVHKGGVGFGNGEPVMSSKAFRVGHLAEELVDRSNSCST